MEVNQKLKHYEKLKKVYPFDKLEDELNYIRELGYGVYACDEFCRIYDGEDRLVVDINAEKDMYLNALLALENFWEPKI